jgi:hypothetical protein
MQTHYKLIATPIKRCIFYQGRFFLSDTAVSRTVVICIFLEKNVYKIKGKYILLTRHAVA